MYHYLIKIPLKSTTGNQQDTHDLSYRMLLFLTKRQQTSSLFQPDTRWTSSTSGTCKMWLTKTPRRHHCPFTSLMQITYFISSRIITASQVFLGWLQFRTSYCITRHIPQWYIHTKCAGFLEMIIVIESGTQTEVCRSQGGPVAKNHIWSETEGATYRLQHLLTVSSNFSLAFCSKPCSVHYSNGLLIVPFFTLPLLIISDTVLSGLSADGQVVAE